MESLDTKINEIKRILKNQFVPVGVKIIKNDDELKRNNVDEYFQDVNSYKRVDKRFCYYIRQAAQEEGFLIKNDNTLDCKNPYFCLGFKESKYNELEHRISPPNTKAILIGPLNKFKTKVDSVIFIMNASQTMLLTDSLYSILKKDIPVTPSAHMAVCFEIVAKSIVNHTTRLSFLCNGARIFSEYKEDELVIGIPYDLFNRLCRRLIKFGEVQQLMIEKKNV